MHGKGFLMCLYARDLRISEGQQIQRILRRSTSRVKLRRSQVVLASSQGFKVPASEPASLTSIDDSCTDVLDWHLRIQNRPQSCQLPAPSSGDCGRRA